MGKHNPYPQKHRPKSSRKGGKLLLQELLESKPKHPVAFVNTLPYKSLRKHVLWLSLPQQDAMEDVTLTNELECFAQYVKVLLFVVDRVTAFGNCLALLLIYRWIRVSRQQGAS